MNKKSVEDIKVENKKVLVRCDFNVPLDKETGVITDNRRIRAALPTIQYLLDNNAKVILCSHLGRPKGEVNPKYSLKPVAEELSKLLQKEVKMAEDVIGDSAKELTSNIKEGEIDGGIGKKFSDDIKTVIKNTYDTAKSWAKAYGESKK